MTIAKLIYLLCAATSLVAAGLLIRRYRARPVPLLFWSACSFAGLCIGNVLVFVDLGIPTQSDLSLPRAAIGAAAMVALVYGLITDAS